MVSVLPREHHRSIPWPGCRADRNELLTYDIDISASDNVGLAAFYVVVKMTGLMLQAHWHLYSRITLTDPMSKKPR